MRVNFTSPPFLSRPHCILLPSVVGAFNRNLGNLFALRFPKFYSFVAKLRISLTFCDIHFCYLDFSNLLFINKKKGTKILIFRGELIDEKYFYYFLSYNNFKLPNL